MSVTAATMRAFYDARIQRDIDREIMRHQASVAAAPDRLNLLADGDSWFDYPLDGIIPGVNTDVIAQLRKQLPVEILNLAHYGYTSTQMMGYSRQQRLRNAVADSKNGKFDGMLLSGGGNDIAGDALCVWLNDAGISTTSINLPRFAAILSCVRACYLDAIALRDEVLPGKPIFVHCYDYPQVSGVGVCMLGPWLKPSFDLCGYARDAAQAVIQNMLFRFRSMLLGLAADEKNNFYVINTQGILEANEWANELHPTPNGFAKIAAAYLPVLTKVYSEKLTPVVRAVHSK